MSAAATADARVWTVLEMIRWSTEYLRDKGIDAAQARLDAEHLLAGALGTGRLQLYLHFDRPLTPEERDAYRPLLRRRAAREPLQYIVGRAAFRELELRVGPEVMIPRPETEELVEAVLEWARSRDTTAATGTDVSSAPTALDVGTGSGCIALSLALEGPFRVVATDPSADALRLARENAEAAGVEARVEFREGSLFEPAAGERFDVVVSNPPYVAEGERPALQPEVREHEPGAALFAGPEGLDVLEPLVAGAARHLTAGGLLALEVGADQTTAVAELIRRAGGFEEPRVRRDLSSRPRMVLAVRAGGVAAQHPLQEAGQSW